MTVPVGQKDARRMFQIHAPLSRTEEVEPLVEAGADGCYAGVFPIERIGKSPVIINRRNHPENNFRSVAELREAQLLLHSAGLELFVTFNEHFYPTEVLSLILEVLDALVDAPGLTGVIVTEIGLMMELRRRYPQLALKASTGCVVQNSAAATLLQELGVNRVVLPRAMTVMEIAMLVRACPGTEFECFVLNDRCPNVDGLCHFVHADFTDSRFPTQCRWVQFSSVCAPKNRPAPGKGNAQTALGTEDLARVFGSESLACAACYVPALYHAGVKGFKIVGRDRSPSDKRRAVRFMAAVRELFRDNTSEAMTRAGHSPVTEETWRRIRELRRQHFDGACHPGLCYLPDPPPTRPQSSRIDSE